MAHVTRVPTLLQHKCMFLARFGVPSIKKTKRIIIKSKVGGSGCYTTGSSDFIRVTYSPSLH